MHAESEGWAMHVIHPAHGLDVVEFGGLDVNGNVRHLFKEARSYVCVDIVSGPGVDVVAPFEEWAFEQPTGSADLVVSLEVLEHAARWGQMIAGAQHILRPGGRFVGTCATVNRAPHSAWGDPWPHPDEHYTNVSPQDLSSAFLPLFADFTINVTRGAMDIRWEATK